MPGVEQRRAWRLSLDLLRASEEQMPFDEALARAAAPSVRLFVWDPPAVSLGLRQPKPGWLSAPAWRAAGLAAVERPTGGGIAFHGSDLSVSIVVPRHAGLSGQTLLRAACESAVKLCGRFGVTAHADSASAGGSAVTYCLTEPSPYAVYAGARKVAGFALRRFPESWLVQGSMLIEPMPKPLLEALPEAMQERLARLSVPLSALAPEPVDALDAAARWAEAWEDWWDAALIAEWVARS